MHARQPSPLGLRAFPAHLCSRREIWVTADEAAGSVTPCSTPGVLAFHTKGRANVAPALDAPLSSSWRQQVLPPQAGGSSCEGERQREPAGSVPEGLQHLTEGLASRGTFCRRGRPPALVPQPQPRAHALWHVLSQRRGLQRRAVVHVICQARG